MIDDRAQPGTTLEREPTSLKVRGLVGGYGDTTVVRDVSLTVPPSSIVALLGPNGAGKTTLLRIISGLLPAGGGEISFGGVDLISMSPNRRAAEGLCLIPEGRGIFPSLTVRDNLRMLGPARQQADGLEKAIAAFPFLADRLNSKAAELSGGQQQMLALSRAYMWDPKLVLVDEASLGLAPLAVDTVFEFLGNLASKGASLLIVEQFIHRALAVADSAYVLNRGSIVFEGTPEDLRRSDVARNYLGTAAAPKML